MIVIDEIEYFYDRIDTVSCTNTSCIYMTREPNDKTIDDFIQDALEWDSLRLCHFDGSYQYNVRVILSLFFLSL